MVCVWRRYAGKTEGREGGMADEARQRARENQRRPVAVAGRYTVHQGNGRCVLFHARLGDWIEENVRTFREKKKEKKTASHRDCSYYFCPDVLWLLSSVIAPRQKEGRNLNVKRREKSASFLSSLSFSFLFFFLFVRMSIIVKMCHIRTIFCDALDS